MMAMRGAARSVGEVERLRENLADSAENFSDIGRFVPGRDL